MINKKEKEKANNTGWMLAGAAVILLIGAVGGYFVGLEAPRDSREVQLTEKLADRAADIHELSKENRDLARNLAGKSRELGKIVGERNEYFLDFRVCDEELVQCMQDNIDLNNLVQDFNETIQDLNGGN